MVMVARSLLGAWISLVIRNPVLTLVLLFVTSALAGWIGVNKFMIDSDTSNLIRQDTEWRRDFEAFKAEFPQFTQTSLIVVSGQNPGELNEVTEALVAELRKDMTWFQYVYAPSADPFYQRHGLLFADVERLDQLVTELAEAQPVLTTLAEDPSLRGIFSLIEQAVTRDEPLPGGLARIASILSSALQDVLAGDLTPLDWQSELFPDSDETLYSIIIVQGKQDFDTQLPNARIVNQIRKVVDSIEKKPGVEIRLTGQSPLDHEELDSARTSAQFAGALALIVLILVLVVGVRSSLVSFATYAAMLIGLVWTSAYAMLSIGSYNTISIVFLVMFIGLGVDFAIHLCLRYQEELARHNRLEALQVACEDVGPALTLCALSTGLGFLAFTFTDYRGLAELGFISFGGMIIALVISLTFLPAFFSLTPAPPVVRPTRAIQTAAKLAVRYELLIVGSTLLLALAALYTARGAYFDFSILALKNPKSEGMQTFRELQKNDIQTGYSLSVLVPPGTDVAGLRQQLLELDVVSEVNGPGSAVPDQQDEKLLILEDLGFILTSALVATPTEAPPDAATRLRLAKELQDTIRARPPREQDDAEASSALSQLEADIEKLLAGSAPDEALAQLERLLVAGFDEELTDLELRLGVSRISFDDLPEPTRERLINAKGLVHLSVLPKYDLASVATLRDFVTSVRSVAGKATGRPALELDIGELVQRSFVEAMVWALVSISLLLLITLRSVIDTLLIFTPLVLTTIFTFSGSALFGIPFNMANVVAIPLVFGLGVDNGVHVVQRFREGLSLPELIRSTTLRAVLLSNLTTLGTFGALGLSTHQGIKSIGLLLVFALSCQLLLTLIALPALLSIFSRRQQSRMAN